MSDTIIFCFGLAVTILVGSGLFTLIVTKNRALRAEEQSHEGALAPATVPARARSER